MHRLNLVHTQSTFCCLVWDEENASELILSAMQGYDEAIIFDCATSYSLHMFKKTAQLSQNYSCSLYLASIDILIHLLAQPFACDIWNCWKFKAWQRRLRENEVVLFKIFHQTFLMGFLVAGYDANKAFQRSCGSIY